MNYIPLLLLLVLISTALGTHHSSHSPVKLDIGGTVFKTTRHTLTKHDGFFKTMMEAETPVEKDDNGCIFIDRDPRHFPSILNYLRDGYVRFPNSEHTVREILREAQNYKLEGLKELCEAKLVTGFQKIEEKNNQSIVVSVAPVPQHSVPVQESKLHNGTLRVIENESDYLNIIAYPTKHVMIFYYAVNIYGRTSIPAGLNAPNFVEKHKDTIDIYFRPWQAGSSGGKEWLWSFFYKDYYVNHVANWAGSHKKYMQEVEETIAKFLVDKPLS